MLQQFVQLPYHLSHISFSYPSDSSVELILPPDNPPLPNPENKLKDLLEQYFTKYPIQSDCRRVVIGVNDKTRPVPYQTILPILINTLIGLGIREDQITFIIATGTHIPVPESEMHELFPESMIGACQITTHDCDNLDSLIYLGKTVRGTHVFTNRQFYEADLKIVVGNIEPHHFMGFSGGAKTASIGLTGRQTITDNHSMITDPDSRLASYETNPMRQDVEEIGKLIGVDLAINAITNEAFQILDFAIGSPLDVMRLGIPIVRQTCMVEVPHLYDMVIASAGGYPKDINLYQAQKGLTHAVQVLRDGGVAILVAACKEGIGSQGYEDFVRGEPSQQAVMTKFSTSGFKIGPHKAFQMARQALRVKIIIVSELPAQTVRDLLLTPAASLDEALGLAKEWLPANPRIAVMPYATHTLATVRG